MSKRFTSSLNRRKNIIIPVKPDLKIEGDSLDEAMNKHGAFVGADTTRAIWRFGFLEGSQRHKQYGVSVPAFTWVIADHHGRVLETFVGFAIELPEQFTDILAIADQTYGTD